MDVPANEAIGYHMNRLAIVQISNSRTAGSIIFRYCKYIHAAYTGFPQ